MTGSLIKVYNEQMLSVFPELLNYSQVAPLILRLCLSVVLIKWGYLNVFKGNEKKEKILGAGQFLSAVLLVTGLLVQPVALLAAATAIIEKKDEKFLKFVVIANALSLMVLGPGLFSLDLPL